MSSTVPPSVMASTDGPVTNAGDWIHAMLVELEARGIPAVYLRNYEELPRSSGNDADLLVPRVDLARAVDLAVRWGARHGWRHVATVEFGCTSVFFVDPSGTADVHIDFFSELDWHWIRFADPDLIRSRRQWNGLVFTPHPLDEVYVNVATRLIYHGAVRPIHRRQAERMLGGHAPAEFARTCRSHLGEGAVAERLASSVVRTDWPAVEGLTRDLRRAALTRAVTRTRREAVTSLRRYGRRTLRRMISPPGPFVVVEGWSDDATAAVAQGIRPLFRRMTGRADALTFRWSAEFRSVRPAAIHGGTSADAPLEFPTPVGGVVALAHRWIGYWWGYLRYVLPARARNRGVIGDHYAYEMYLDPARAHLKVPPWLARLAAATVPQPDLVLGLVASDAPCGAAPDEAGPSGEYQHRVCELAARSRRVVLLRTDGSPGDVQARARAIVLDLLANSASGHT